MANAFFVLSLFILHTIILLLVGYIFLVVDCDYSF